MLEEYGFTNLNLFQVTVLLILVGFIVHVGAVSLALWRIIFAEMRNRNKYMDLAWSVIDLPVEDPRVDEVQNQLELLDLEYEELGGRFKGTMARHPILTGITKILSQKGKQ